MYILLLIVLLVPGGIMIKRGLDRHSVSLLAGGLLWGALVGLFFFLLDFWGEKLWFDALGFAARFWTEIAARSLFIAGGALFSMAAIWLMAGRKNPFAPFFSLAGLLIGARWGMIHWQELLLYFYRVETTLTEPVLNMQTGFYLFSLPFFDALVVLLLQTVLLGLAAAVIAHFFSLVRQGSRFRIREMLGPDTGTQNRSANRLYIDGALCFFVLSGGMYLLRFHLLYSTWGTVTGAGWTDVHVRLPAYWALLILTAAAGCGFLFLAAGVLRTGKRKTHTVDPRRHYPVLLLGGCAALVVMTWFLLMTVLPGLFQWLRVEPNEITLEKPYIANNIKFTRHGFALHNVEEREFPVTDEFNARTVAENRKLLNNIRLWDRGALDAVYKQFQEIRLYYEFVGVDIDRYMVGQDYRQVMVSAREMEPGNLPAGSRTFVNRRFKYTHGYGITLTPVSDFTPEGLPDMLVKNIPPQSAHANLVVKQPEIYYGELTDSHVIANSSEEEFDYPMGEDNVYTHYQGRGGVELKNFWRKFLYGWKFDGTRLLFSGYPTAESRILFDRKITDRVKKIAPFLIFDDDPYVVLADGRLYWIIDAYTTSDYYPYSEPYFSRETIEYRNGRQAFSSWISRSLHGINYIRNSVKAVVDAYNGDVRFYVFAEDDPLIRAWQQVFPGMFRSRQEMDQALKFHVRYPLDMLQVQGLVYAKYHMGDPRVFYNQEDLWVRATEKYYGTVQPLQPYYVMWEMPGSDRLQFVLIQPFTPKNRQVMIGWIAGMCDGENYGRFLVYKFPKEKRVLGPQQVETKIDQDRFLSGQLTLWDQRGSNVIRGNVLAIPIEDTILYVEPIYLQAETAAYPELRLVILMHNDRLTYGPTFDDALAKLLGGEKKRGGAEPVGLAGPGVMELVRRADEALSSYLRQTGEGHFREAADSLGRLREVLNQLLQKNEPAGEPASPWPGGE